jgi:uncharacterized protein YbjQ (UPF0145 family)
MFTPADSPTVDDLPDFLVDDEPVAEITLPIESSTVESTDDYTDTVTSDEATEPTAADADDIEEGTRGGDAEDSDSKGALSGEDNETDLVDAPESIDEAGADPGFVEIDDEAGPIPPLPPMQTTTPSFDADPFKVDADDLRSVESRSLEESASPVFSNPSPIVGTIATGVSEKKPIPEDWGTRSDEAYEGWVQDDQGVETWRMIVTNLSTVAGYDIDEFLGLAVADSMVSSHDVQAVASGRRAAIDALTEDGVLRGAHAIVAVTHAIQPVGDQILVTVSGTAVTLKPITSR